MAYYIGIDLGTTNSAICSYDGMTTRIWKSPEQTDVTPSAIYIDKRGNRYYGQKACS
jgi:molecular chaperone DnaK